MSNAHGPKGHVHCVVGDACCPEGATRIARAHSHRRRRCECAYCAKCMQRSCMHFALKAHAMQRSCMACAHGPNCMARRAMQLGLQRDMHIAEGDVHIAQGVVACSEAACNYACRHIRTQRSWVRMCPGAMRMQRSCIRIAPTGHTRIAEGDASMPTARSACSEAACTSR